MECAPPSDLSGIFRDLIPLILDYLSDPADKGSLRALCRDGRAAYAAHATSLSLRDFYYLDAEANALNLAASRGPPIGAPLLSVPVAVAVAAALPRLRSLRLVSEKALYCPDYPFVEPMPNLLQEEDLAGLIELLRPQGRGSVQGGGSRGGSCCDRGSDSTSSSSRKSNRGSGSAGSAGIPTSVSSPAPLLQSLELRGVQGSPLPPSLAPALRSCAGLRDLTRSFDEWEDEEDEEHHPCRKAIGALRRLPQLTSLRLGHVGDTTHVLGDVFGPGCRMTGLRRLAVTGNEALANELDVWPLSGLPHLQELTLTNAVLTLGGPAGGGGALAAPAALTLLHVGELHSPAADFTGRHDPVESDDDGAGPPALGQRRRRHRRRSKAKRSGPVEAPGAALHRQRLLLPPNLSSKLLKPAEGPLGNSTGTGGGGDGGGACASRAGGGDGDCASAAGGGGSGGSDSAAVANGGGGGEGASAGAGQSPSTAAGVAAHHGRWLAALGGCGVTHLKLEGIALSARDFATMAENMTALELAALPRLLRLDLELSAAIPSPAHERELATYLAAQAARLPGPLDALPALLAAAPGLQRGYATVFAAEPVHPTAFRSRWGPPGALRTLTLAARRRLWRATAASGVVQNLELLYDVSGCLPGWEVFAAAAAAGRLEACGLLLRRRCPWGPEVTEAAARAGRLEACRWLAVRGCPRPKDAVVAAAVSGSRELYEWFRDRAGSFRSDALAMKAAAAAGEERLAYRIQNSLNTRHVRVSYLVAAASGCSLQMVQSLYSQIVYGRLRYEGERPPDGGRGELSRWEMEEVVAAAAASSTGDWAAKVEWLLRRGLPRAATAAERVAATVAEAEAGLPRGSAAGRLAWLRAWGFPLGPPTVEAAASSGDLAALRYLLAEGALRDDGGGAAAAADDDTATAAAAGAAGAARAAAARGDVAALELLQDHGANLYGAELAAAAGSHVAALAWLAEALLPPGDRPSPAGAAQLADATGASGSASGEAFLRAARNGDLSTVACLARLGCLRGPPGRVLTAAVTAGCRPAALEALLRAGCCPADWRAAERAAMSRRRSRPGVVAWVQRAMRMQRQQRHQEAEGAQQVGVQQERGKQVDGGGGGGCVRDESGRGEWAWVHGRLVEWWEAVEAEELGCTCELSRRRGECLCHTAGDDEYDDFYYEDGYLYGDGKCGYDL
ncbi:hypothetical protein GPECTOR_57g455 [Gonium pectorale]|uniref:Uncharacterized protein n=1 Tax=Gonium pectorale TaxID=33097 RepID=A0A150G6K8_GONPE|nr:hypothetical protein GPECTOR_57g455 [Gonium pectorale]|eukprot:KXZ45165.1 hypothetical protein GPECTOR_57g455 [Gonium pectorale]